MKTVCIIPARMESSRFYGKPIKKILGYPMIEHVFRRVQIAQHVDEIYIATCNQEIKEVAEAFGAKVIMTSDKHTRGTDRVAEAASEINADIVINVQGDEPLVDPKSLDKAIKMMKDGNAIHCINLVAPIDEWDVFISKNVVKAQIDNENRVIKFFRQPDAVNNEKTFTQGIKQIGIYLFRKTFLTQFAAWEETPREKQEGVDMMRIIDKGFSIDTCMSADMISVDTPEELEEMERLLQKDPVFQRVFKGTSVR